MEKLLLTEGKLGSTTLLNRIIMAPMTRARATQPGDVPNEMMAKYYSQRTSAGLIITEATQISKQGQGYSFTPGIYTDEHVIGWKKVTDAVHKNGGKIFVQLWHVGRMSHASFHEDGLPVAPSALSPKAKVWIVNPETGIGEMVDCPVPRALETSEIKDIIEDYRKSAARAVEAGFDGIEIHGANGYLIDEFLRRSSNHRTDEYGGSQENRMRFVIEVMNAVAKEIPLNKVGIRLSPFITQREMLDEETPDTTLKLVRKLNDLGLAYVHISEADWEDAPITPEPFRKDLREAFSGSIIVAGKYNVDKAENLLNAKLVDFVAFGRPFIANPDYPRRVRENLELSNFDNSTLFGGDEKGYSDYKPYGE